MSVVCKCGNTKKPDYSTCFVCYQRTEKWTESDTTGKKRQRLVRYLMRQGRDLETSKKIAARKYPT